MPDSGLRTVIFIYFITHLFYRQFLAVSSSKRIFKISQQLMKLSQKVRHHFFLRQCIGNSTWAERSPAPGASVSYLKLPRHSPQIILRCPLSRQNANIQSSFKILFGYIDQFGWDLKTYLFPAHSKHQRIRGI